MEREHGYRRGVRIDRRYLWGSGLPILAGLTLLCAALLLGRHGVGCWRCYGFLLWNLFLAWLPYLFSLAADLLDRARPRAFGPLALLAVLWLAFLPNAPYILTDFIHLRRVPSTSYGYDFMLIATFAGTGCLLGAMSLLIMQLLVGRYVGRGWGWAFAVVIVGLSGAGVYVGRFLRWNSWDLFTRPLHVIDTVTEALRDPLDHPRALTLSLLLAVFLLGCYVLFYALATRLLGRRRAAGDR